MFLVILLAFKAVKIMKTTILIIGANGQLGAVLTPALQEKYGVENVIASDISEQKTATGIFEFVDATDIKSIQRIVTKYKVTQIYHLAAILSAKGEAKPLKTWDINMSTWLNVLEVSRKNNINKVFYPSSIAVFGNGINQINTPNDAYLDPSTVYGISKATGENWAQYYYLKYGLDVRSIRYPGIIGHQSLPGGGTTDYAVDIFHKAVLGETYHCFLSAKSTLPMLYINDAIRATIALMEAPKESLKIRTSYNITGVSFSPKEVASAIQKIIPDFTIIYAPDFRQSIANSWPKSIDDSEARNDWGWNPTYNLTRITAEMVKELTTYYNQLDKSKKDISLCI